MLEAPSTNSGPRSFEPIVPRLAAFAGLLVLGHVAAVIIALALIVTKVHPRVTSWPLAGLAVLAVSWVVLRRFDGRSLRDLGIGVDRPWMRHLVLGALAGGALITLGWLVLRSQGLADSQLN